MALYCPRSGCEWFCPLKEPPTHGACTKPDVVLEVAGTGGLLVCISFSGVGVGGRAGPDVPPAAEPAPGDSGTVGEDGD